MKALTIWQPWASAIVAGIKLVENRTWYPPRCLVGCWIGIHAGRVLDAKAVRDITAENLWLEIPDASDLPKGALLGTVRIARVSDHIDPDDPWQCGPVVWHLDNPIKLAEPLPMRGKQGLWTLPEIAPLENSPHGPHR